MIMTLIEDVLQTEVTVPRLTLTIGSFDGVHRGHRCILEQVIARTRQRQGSAGVLTFRPHPRQVFSPGHAPNLLTPDAKKLALLQEAGIDAVYLMPFDAKTASMPPEAFVREVIVERCHAEAVIVGHDFRFGHRAEGDYGFLVEAGKRHGFEAAQVPALLLDGERVSSTVIRERILEGDLRQAEKLLGRRYSIVGEVVQGRGIGRGLGFPTANIRPLHSAVPPHGVYAAKALLPGREAMAAVNIGIAPTIRHEDITIEAYLLDFEADIAGQGIELVFHERLRPERKFESRDALVRQIRADVEEVRKVLSGHA